MTNLKFKYLIKNITINFWFSENFASMDEKEKKKKNLMIDLLKITFNKKIFGRVVAKLYPTI